MNIAIFSELYAPSIGGQESFFATLGALLHARGHKVDVYCIGHIDTLPDSELIEGLQVYRYPNSGKYKRPDAKFIRRDWSQIIRYALHVRRVAAKDIYDFYILNEFPLFHALFLPGRARRKALLHWCEVRRSTFYRIVQSTFPKLTRLNAAISKPVSEQIAAASGRPVFVLPSGVDLSRSVIRPREVRRDIVVLGRVMFHKNVPFLIDAYEIMRSAGYEGRLKIAGDGPAMDELRQKIASSSARDYIDTLGFISDDQKFELLAASELLAMPSKREGFPHVIAEAMCCGLPIVTVDYPENGTKDIVSMYDVGVVSRADPGAFASAVQDCLKSWNTYSENGISAALSLSWPSIADNLERRMLEALPGSPA